MGLPNRAKTTMTPKATTAACQASRLRSRAGLPRVSPRKTGTMPGGSVMTSKVTKTSKKNFMSASVSLYRDRSGGLGYQALVGVRRDCLATDPVLGEGAMIVTAAAGHE